MKNPFEAYLLEGPAATKISRHVFLLSEASRAAIYAQRCHRMMQQLQWAWTARGTRKCKARQEFPVSWSPGDCYISPSLTNKSSFNCTTWSNSWPSGTLVSLNSYMNLWIIWIHIWNDHMNSWATWILHEFIHEMIIGIHSPHEFIYEMTTWIQEYVNSCIWIHVYRFWISIWIHRYMNSCNEFICIDFEFTYTNS